MLLTLGLLYKLQKAQTHWYYDQHLFIHDQAFENKLLNICGYYWQQLVKVRSLRSYVSIDRLSTQHVLSPPVFVAPFGDTSCTRQIAWGPDSALSTHF